MWIDGRMFNDMKALMLMKRSNKSVARSWKVRLRSAEATISSLCTKSHMLPHRQPDVYSHRYIAKLKTAYPRLALHWTQTRRFAGISQCLVTEKRTLMPPVLRCQRREPLSLGLVELLFLVFVSTTSRGKACAGPHSPKDHLHGYR